MYIAKAYSQCLNRGGTRVHAIPLLLFCWGNDVPPLSRLNFDEDNRFALTYETSSNGFRDNNGKNVPEELKQAFTCVDSLPGL